MLWRDIDLFPIKIKDNILGKEEGDVFSVAFKKGELFKYSDDNVLDLQTKQFQSPHSYRGRIKPKLGRFLSSRILHRTQRSFSAKYQTCESH